MKNKNNSWEYISKKSNENKSSYLKRKSFWKENLEVIHGLESDDIDGDNLKAPSILYDAAFDSRNTVSSILDGWKRNGELNEIFYRIAGEGTIEDICKTFRSLQISEKNKEIDNFHTSIFNSSRVEDLIENSNLSGIYNILSALNSVPKKDQSNEMKTTIDLAEQRSEYSLNHFPKSGKIMQHNGFNKALTIAQKNFDNKPKLSYYYKDGPQYVGNLGNKSNNTPLRTALSILEEENAKRNKSGFLR